jgi:DNA primase
VGVSRDTLERIKAGAGPLSIVREAVPSLKQSGARWKGNCPFHNERTPSFYFQPDKGLWHCFGACQEGGDILKFVMKLEGFRFRRRLRELAHRTGRAGLGQDGRCGQSARQRTGPAVGPSGRGRRVLPGQPSRVGRGGSRSAPRCLSGVRPETVDRFPLGFSPRRDGFLDAALKRGRRH